MNHGSNVMSIKKNVNGATGLVAAMSDAGRVFPRLIALAAAAATVSAQAEPSLAGVATAARPALTVDVGCAAVGSQAEAGSVVPASAAREPLPDGTPVAGFEVIWVGRLSISEAPADDSQWWWLRGHGVNT